jgi:TFIIF-interacting CTD phosphatase-like protein
VVKDLELFTGGDFRLEDILIIDNNLFSFAFNLENGIPVQHFKGDKNDTCLLQVMKYLKYIKDFDNLAEQNEKIYQFRKVFNSDIQDYIGFYYEDDMSSSDNDYD